MDICDSELSDGILFDCNNRPKAKLEGNQGVLINRKDIDFAASIVNGSVIEDLVLKPGKSGFPMQWWKDLASNSAAYVPSTEDVDGFSNQFNCRFPSSTREFAERANELANAYVISVMETKFKGVDNRDAFKVEGWDVGMRLSELTWNTNENSGSMPFVVSTMEGDFEKYPYRIFSEVDYATSLATFESLFANV